MTRHGGRTSRGGGSATARGPRDGRAAGRARGSLHGSPGRTRRLLAQRRTEQTRGAGPSAPAPGNGQPQPSAIRRRLRHRWAGGARRPCRAPGTVGGTATRPGVRPGPISTGGVPAGGEPDAAERRRGRLSPVAASFGRCARATPQAPSRSLASSLLASCVRRPARRPPRRRTGVYGPGREGRRAPRTARVRSVGAPGRRGLALTPLDGVNQGRQPVRHIQRRRFAQ